MKTYIAGPFFDPDQIATIIEIENTLKICGQKFFSPRAEGTLGNMAPEQRAEAAKVIYKSNIDNLHRCESMVAVIDGSDTGVSFELGYFTALRDVGFAKTLITITLEKHKLNVMLAESVNAHVYNFTALAYSIKLLMEGKIKHDTEFAEFKGDVF